MPDSTLELKAAHAVGDIHVEGEIVEYQCPNEAGKTIVLEPDPGNTATYKQECDACKIHILI